MKILVVDDEPFVLKLLVRQLENLGYTEVIPHSRAQDALALLGIEGASVGLIFCDLQMPEMDGVEFVRQLVGVGYVGGLVLVSGEDERILHAAENLARSHKLDVLGALQKPVSSERLQTVLESNLFRSATSPARAPHKKYDPEAVRRAIAEGELVNDYQPKVEFASGVVAGVETLVRWKHPRDGLVYPDQFIPVAEEHGLIDDLTRAVLSAALRQSRLWQYMGITLSVAVNVSMDNLRSVEFPDLITREMNETGVPASLLVLEVTESRLMKDPLVALDILTRLRLKRIGLSIDDFGTGHSSLAQLRDLPFEELKVDRGFVHGACHDASRTAILQASLRMARQLRMKSVAEGVEDREDWDFLRATGCDFAQGYFIAKPMPAEALPTWLNAWRARHQELFGTAP
jgi:EAL domain-containing protein (putative c-di-GMP-specific phosphodiesterase class I)/DNA-binding NarL/FixJ family response regulator